jgi:nucleoside-diphosphate-sugar epimerase
MNKPAPAIVIVGCGDIGTKVAQKYLAQGHKVSALVRSESSVHRLNLLNIAVYQADLSQPLTMHLPAIDSQLFYFAPPPSQGVTDSHTLHLLQMLNDSEQLPKRIVYISTTGVYGDCQGRWITEDEPTNPQADRARRRLDGEQQLLAFGKLTGVEIIILRVAGIYGPGKLPLKRLQQGQPVIRQDQSPYTNRIHSADLVKIAMAAMQRGTPGAIYHACDGHPGTMTGYFKEIARRAGLPAPPEISLQQGNTKLSPGMMSYMRESRRLSNKKTLQELNITLDYPTLEKGLDNCFQTLTDKYNPE